MKLPLVGEANNDESDLSHPLALCAEDPLSSSFAAVPHLDCPTSSQPGKAICTTEGRA